MPSAINWNDVDTVLLDMDGTLLDLNYDNVLWNERLPERYATHHRVTTRHGATNARTSFRRNAPYDRALLPRLLGPLHQSRHARVASRIVAPDPLPTARRSLSRAAQGDRSARRAGDERTSRRPVDQRPADGTHATSRSVVFVARLRRAQGVAQFWTRLEDAFPFDVSRALLIDDNAAVLAAAQRHGIAQLLTVSAAGLFATRRDRNSLIRRSTASTRSCRERVERLAKRTPAKVRLDRWLWAARFYKTRSAAKDAIDGGRCIAADSAQNHRKRSASGSNS